ncbi:MAG: DUF4265 domain-containing protein [Cardiobacteriaceae bacterium]|nr:DUF4265 domain-containing protein [Cardiobacteriaceae bacterium]
MTNTVIRIYYENEEGQASVESLICDSANDNLFEIIQIPLWAYSLSLEDVIICSTDPLDINALSFEKHHHHSGNSTIQIVELQKWGLFQIIPNLESFLGKQNIRFNSSSYIAINIPANVDYKPIKTFLQKYEDDEIISYKEAKIGQNHEYEGCYG